MQMTVFVIIINSRALCDSRNSYSRTLTAISVFSFIFRKSIIILLSNYDTSSDKSCAA